MGDKLKVFRETTKDWSVPQKNHTYILSSNKQWMYGYITEGKSARDVVMLKNRMQFNTRYRTFKEVK
jgi:hypothetical protein